MVNNTPICNRQSGYTLIEIVMVIVILGVLTVVAAVKWPTGMGEDAAVLEFKRAVRYAQHMALTRQYISSGSAWGITVSGNKYTVKRADGSATAGADYVNRSLPGDTSVGPNSVWFNGIGEPIDGGGTPLAAQVTFGIGVSSQINVCPETGYVMKGASCP
ncbi:MAG: type II secretion system protein [Desulfobulbaceae bacterium]|nr:type II secretion system protein [Desulfobulbaceae bacterium]MCK5437211.1 type II secretion system protein [Desulfobulbaceae bacterium]